MKPTILYEGKRNNVLGAFWNDKGEITSLSATVNGNYTEFYDTSQLRYVHEKGINCKVMDLNNGCVDLNTNPIIKQIYERINRNYEVRLAEMDMLAHQIVNSDLPFPEERNRYFHCQRETVTLLEVLEILEDYFDE